MSVRSYILTHMPNLPLSRVRAFALAFVPFLLVLQGCGSEPAKSMPASQSIRLVLDLSGSNDVLDQYERLKPALYKELNSDSIGNPFSKKPTGPIDLSITFIVGSASQSRVDSIISSDFGAKLFRDLQEVYGRSSDQIAADWPLVIASDRKSLELAMSPDLTSCVKNVAGIMEVNLGQEISQEIARSLCERSIKTIETVENQVPNSIERASGSDIFGAFRELETWIEKERSAKPKTKFKVIFASDMVHSTKGQRDLFGTSGLLSGKIGKTEICLIAKDQAALSALNLKGVSVEIIGRGNAKSVSADEGEALAIFWECFAKESRFELSTVSDGRG